MTTASITMADSDLAIPLEKGLPLIGCLPEMAKNPIDFFKRLVQKYPDCVEFSVPLTRLALITSAELSHQILVKENSRFRKADRDMKIMGSLLGTGLVTNNQHDSHKVQRKLVQPGFHFRRIEGYAQTMADYSQRYLEDWGDSGTRDISDDMFRLTMYIVSKTLFDTDMEDLSNDSNQIGLAIHEFQRIADSRFNQVFQSPDWLPTPRNLKIKKIRAVLNETMRTMISKRTDEQGNISERGDLLSMLLNAEYEDGSKMSEKQLLDELVTLFIAGHETTSNALTWTFYLIAKHPEIQEKLHAELDQVLDDSSPSFGDLDALTYTEMVIKESMRILPPVWTLNCRQANEEMVLGNYHIPKDKVFFIAPAANHFNPKYFKDPERFDPERFSAENEKKLPRYAYIPFGGGPRVCIGNSFAMMEAKLILATFAQQYKISLDPAQTIDPQPQITLSNKGGMSVNYTKRKRAS